MAKPPKPKPLAQVRVKLRQVIAELAAQPDPGPYVRDAASFAQQAGVCIDKQLEMSDTGGTQPSND